MSRTFTAALPVALLLLAACATGGGDIAPEEEVTITVENGLFPRTDLTVRLITPTGQSQVLGSVLPGGSGTLRYRGRVYPDFYRLLATTARGDDIASQPFNIFRGAQVTWSLPQNSVSVYPRESA